MNAVPYAAVLKNRSPQTVITQTPAALSEVIRRVSSERVGQPSAPGKWSLREIAAHIADCEIVWSWRLRTAYENDRAQIQPFEQDAWAKMYAQYTLDGAMAVFTSLRAWNVAFIAGLSEADRQKPTFHPERGEETLWTIVEIMAGHDLHHLAALEKLFPAATL